MTSAVHVVAPAADAFHSGRSAYTAKLAAWLIDVVNWTEEDISVVHDIADQVAAAMNAALVDELGRLPASEAEELGGPLTEASEADHLLCSLCVIVLEAHNLGKAAMHEAVVALARQLVLAMDFRPSAVAVIAQAVLTKVLQAGADVLWKSVINPAAIQLIQLIGADCPAWDEHPDGQIFKLCAAPLLKAGLLEIESEEFEKRFSPASGLRFR